MPRLGWRHLAYSTPTLLGVGQEIHVHVHVHTGIPYIHVHARQSACIMYIVNSCAVWSMLPAITHHVSNTPMIRAKPTKLLPMKTCIAAWKMFTFEIANFGQFVKNLPLENFLLWYMFTTKEFHDRSNNIPTLKLKYRCRYMQAQCRFDSAMHSTIHSTAHVPGGDHVTYTAQYVTMNVGIDQIYLRCLFPPSSMNFLYILE